MVYETSSRGQGSCGRGWGGIRPAPAGWLAVGGGAGLAGPRRVGMTAGRWLRYARVRLTDAATNAVTLPTAGAARRVAASLGGGGAGGGGGRCAWGTCSPPGGGGRGGWARPRRKSGRGGAGSPRGPVRPPAHGGPPRRLLPGA